MSKTLKCLAAVTLLFVPAAARAWWGPPPPPPGPCWGGGWGYGACAVGAGLVGGLLGAAIYDAVRPTPTVVREPAYVQQPVVVQAQPVVVQQQQPVVVQQQALPAAQPAARQTVWVEGCYISQTQADGSVVRVWNPGHYEQR